MSQSTNTNSSNCQLQRAMNERMIFPRNLIYLRLTCLAYRCRSDFKDLATEFILRGGKTFIMIATCDNSATFAEFKMRFSPIIIDEAAIAVEFDILVALQILYDNVLSLGESDHLQSHPVVISKCEYYR
ncbi:hypothetical protein B0J14DRAFT_570135 [Halenospora varia]|nr:hypothetical protein B0J14DRAFT_570135 [Halenospora varia]